MGLCIEEDESSMPAESPNLTGEGTAPPGESRKDAERFIAPKRQQIRCQSRIPTQKENPYHTVD
jgi:hypothetical protein